MTAKKMLEEALRTMPDDLYVEYICGINKQPCIMEDFPNCPECEIGIKVQKLKCGIKD